MHEEQLELVFHGDIYPVMDAYLSLVPRIPLPAPYYCGHKGGRKCKFAHMGRNHLSYSIGNLRKGPIISGDNGNNQLISSYQVVHGFNELPLEL
jgi:hypothetical protein